MSDVEPETQPETNREYSGVQTAWKARQVLTPLHTMHVDGLTCGMTLAEGVGIWPVDQLGKQLADCWGPPPHTTVHKDTHPAQWRMDCSPHTPRLTWTSRDSEDRALSVCLTTLSS